MNNFLFNFSASHAGGGYKRMFEYSKWFNDNGGAYFIIKQKNANLIKEFKNNRYFVTDQSPFQRIFNDSSYLKKITDEVGKPEFYYSYGIPMYYRIAKINWFHLSNVLPLIPFSICMSIDKRIKYIILGHKVRNGLRYSDVISAESRYSLNLINSKFNSKKQLSVNGSDDELSLLINGFSLPKENFALVIGTYWYKALDDSHNIFKMLKKQNSDLKLIIIGKDYSISRKIKMDKDVQLISDFLDRDVLLSYLERCCYYICTSRIENSYNAISEGIFFAQESFVSDIGPHKELLESYDIETITVPNVTGSIFHIYKEQINTSNLKSWDTIIKDMLHHIKLNL